MNKLKAGYSRLDITPATGINISGYFLERVADGVLDSLEVCAAAIATEEKTLVFLAVDNLGIRMNLVADFKAKICRKTGLAPETIIISATHSHTAAQLSDEAGVKSNAAVSAYVEFVGDKLADAALFAVEDLKPAKMGYKIGTAPNVAFVRRFRMKDGSVRTNPGVGNPDIKAPIGEVDERVNVIRFDRENADSIVIMNFGNHPDTVGGCKLSADWPGFARRTLERCLPNVKSLLINGAQGDVNHVNVWAKDGDNNDLARDFDDVARGYGHARHIGNAVAGAVMQIFDKVNYIDVSDIKWIEKKVLIPANVPAAEELALAHKYKELHEAGRDAEIPFEAMELTTAVAEALRMVDLENGPEVFEMKMTAVAIGDVAFITIPGEPFTEIGRELKKAEGWSLVCPCALSNGYEGYFPTREAYEEGGYEARSSYFKAGVAELFIKEGLELLKQLRG